MSDQRELTVFYWADDGTFSWAEVNATEYLELPENVWGYFRYNDDGSMDDSYFCRDTDEASKYIYCFFDTYMKPVRLEYMCYDSETKEQTTYVYSFKTREWSLPEGVSALPFDGDEIIAAAYQPDVRIVRNSSAELPDGIEFGFTEESRENEKPIVGELSEGFLVDDYLAPLSMKNEDYFLSVCQTPPEFTCVQLSGPETKVYTDKDDVIRLAELQTEPCKLEYEVKVTWGPYTAATRFTVNFFTCECPKTLGFERSYTVPKGTELDLCPNYDDGAWPHALWHGMYLHDYDSSTMYDSDGNSILDISNKQVKSPYGEDTHLIISALRPGSTEIVVQAEQDGLAWRGTIQITVTDNETPENNPVTAFVNRCYSLIMNRDADAAGLADWVTKLQNKTSTASEIIYGFMYSEEFIKRNLTNEEAVEILYKTMLNRASDAAGKADWVSRLSDGYENLDVINGFCGSPEFIALCNSYGITPGSVVLDADPDSVAAFVRRCYRLILKRGADDAGLTDWVNNLKSGAKTASEIIHGFMYSNEYIERKMSDSATIEILYRTMLDRGSDAAGKQDWLTKLSQGQTKVDIINGFCGSQEFIALCRSFGIEPGHVTVTEAAAALDNALKAVKKTPEAKMEVFENVTKEQNKAAGSDESGKSVKKNGVNGEKAKKFVLRCYQAALNREANEAELTEWVNQIVDGTGSAEAIVRGFLFSDEFKARNLSSEETVKILYRVYMNREADPEGLAFWTAQLAEGMSLEEAVKGFAASDEFKSILRNMKK